MRFLLLALLAALCAAQTVSCGGHSADNCESCPQGNGAAWCNGDCTWVDNQCVLPTIHCSDGSQVSKCDECAELVCNTNDCVWNQRTSLCRDQLDNDVRTASVHLEYPAPSNMNWWINTITPVSLAEVTYFSSNGHAFGYGGIQQVTHTDATHEGVAIFSIWDQGCDADVDETCDDAATVACGTDVLCQDFGGEGTGRKSMLTIPDLVIGEKYYFVSHTKPITGTQRATVSGYIYVPTLGWRFMSSIAMNTAGNPYFRGLYSFVEQWAPEETLTVRGAGYGPTFYLNEEISASATCDSLNLQQIVTTSFDHGTLENHCYVNAYKNPNNFVVIETGGDVVQQAEKHENFDYDPVEPDAIISKFKCAMPCLEHAATATEKEACLETLKPTENCLELEGTDSQIKCLETRVAEFESRLDEVRSQISADACSSAVTQIERICS